MDRVNDDYKAWAALAAAAAANRAPRNADGTLTPAGARDERPAPDLPPLEWDGTDGA